MKKFEFRLQRVLDYREAVAQWAREAYIEARAARLRAENLRDALRKRRSSLLFSPSESLTDRLALEAALDILDQAEREQEIVIEDLLRDEQACLAEWLRKRQEFEALQKLREGEFRAWMVEANRAEQKELDEWAVRSRAA